MNRGSKLLCQFLRDLRAKVSERTFVEAPELFKDIESLKAMVRHREGLVRREP